MLCKVANLADAATCGSKLPRSLHLSKVSAKAATLLRRAAGSPAPKAERLRARAVKGLQKIRVQIVRLTHRERLTAECSASIDVRVQEAVGLIQKLG